MDISQATLNLNTEPLSAVHKKSCWSIRISVSGSDLRSLVAALLVLIWEYPVSYLNDEPPGNFSYISSALVDKYLDSASNKATTSLCAILTNIYLRIT